MKLCSIRNTKLLKATVNHNVDCRGYQRLNYNNRSVHQKSRKK